MDMVHHSIILKLAEKGLNLQEISRFIKDFFLIIDRGQGAHLSILNINSGLKNLGWMNPMADSHLADLIMAMHEKDQGHAMDHILQSFHLQIKENYPLQLMKNT